MLTSMATGPPALPHATRCRRKFSTFQGIRFQIFTCLLTRTSHPIPELYGTLMHSPRRIAQNKTRRCERQLWAGETHGRGHTVPAQLRHSPAPSQAGTAGCGLSSGCPDRYGATCYFGASRCLCVS